MIEKKNKLCEDCGSPSGTWNKCVRCRARIYQERSRKKREAMGKADDKMEKFFRYAWDNLDHVCAECMKPVTEYKRWHIHHVLPKAKYPHFATDIRNVIILCYQHHNEIESAISAPKLKVFPYCESVKKELLESWNK